MNFWPQSVDSSLVPLKYACVLNPEALPETTDHDHVIEYVDIGSVSLEKGIGTRELLQFGQAPSRARKPIRNGDTLIATVRTYLRAIALVEEASNNWVASTGFAVCRPRQNVEPRYLYRVLQSSPFVESVVAWSTGVSYPAINPSTLGRLPIPLPDRPTQESIADFLDQEIARIDQLIAKKERLVELVHLSMVSKNHGAVTGKGIEPGHHKETGVKWFASIPVHWEMKPLRHVAYFQRGHDLPAESRLPGKVPLVSSGGVTSEHNTPAARGPGIVTGRYGTVGAFYFVKEDYWPLNTTLYTRRIFEYPRYVWYLLQDMAHIFLLNSSKSAVPGVDRNDIHGELVPVPSIDEQILIAQELDDYLVVTDALSRKVTDSIELLTEFRSALITAAVTGQINVETWGRRGETDRRLDAIHHNLEAERSEAAV